MNKTTKQLNRVYSDPNNQPKEAYMKALLKKQAKAVKATETWVTIDGAKVRHVWACRADKEDCATAGTETTVGPDFYEQNGTPVCGTCGDDMEYLRTEIRKE